MGKIYSKLEYDIHPSDWQKNDCLLGNLYDLITTLGDSRIGEVTLFDDVTFEIKEEKDPYEVTIYKNNKRLITWRADKK